MTACVVTDGCMRDQSVSPPVAPPTASAPPATAPAPPPSVSAPPAPPSAAPAGRPVATPRRDARGAPRQSRQRTLCRSARGSLSLLSSLHTIRKRSRARFRGHHTRTDPLQVPRGGAVYPWCRRLRLGRSSILTFCRDTCYIRDGI